MPPTSVHFNGGVNMPDTETVLRELAARVGDLAHAYPDGEPGERNNWIAFQLPRLQAAEGLIDAGMRTLPRVDDLPQVRLADGVEPDEVDFGNLGYADEYLASYETFLRLRAEEVILESVRFQVQYPTPLAPLRAFVLPNDFERLLPAYERAMFADLSRLLASIPHHDIVVQWDVAQEIGMLEGAIESARDSVPARLARCVDAVPDDVPVGMHLCYGDYKHKHAFEPESLQTQVELVNATLPKASRSVEFIAFTVPQYRDDQQYFEPLAELAVDFGRAYFGIVPYYPDRQAAGTTARQVELIDRYVSEWGLCTECGMARAEAEDVPRLLDLHRGIIEAHGGPVAV